MMNKNEVQNKKPQESQEIKESISSDLLYAFRFNIKVYRGLLKDAKKQRRTKDEWIAYGKTKGMEHAMEILKGK